MNIQKITFISSIALLFACTQEPQGITITGSIENPTSDTVRFVVQDTTYYATLDEDYQFNIQFSVDTASYVYFIHGQESSAMYLYGDEQINFSIDTELFDETIEYIGSPASSYLAKKYLLEENADLWSKMYNSSWTEFQVGLNDYKNAVMEELHFLTDSGFIALEKIDMEQMAKYFEHTITSFDKLPKPGEAAIDFRYPDRNGNEYALTDFKGKLVYVDVWATWCGPCVREIPHLINLEKDYHDMDIVFLSVSVDDNKEAWEKMLDDYNMGGVQIIGDKGWQTGIMQSYAINGIPRFMLFNKEGNIISLMAPRPSSEGIRTLIDQYL